MKPKIKPTKMWGIVTKRGVVIEANLRKRHWPKEYLLPGDVIQPVLVTGWQKGKRK